MKLHTVYKGTLSGVLFALIVQKIPLSNFFYTSTATDAIDKHQVWSEIGRKGVVCHLPLLVFYVLVKVIQCQKVNSDNRVVLYQRTLEGVLQCNWKFSEIWVWRPGAELACASQQQKLMRKFCKSRVSWAVWFSTKCSQLSLVIWSSRVPWILMIWSGVVWFGNGNTDCSGLSN